MGFYLVVLVVVLALASVVVRFRCLVSAFLGPPLHFLSVRQVTH